MLNQLVIVGRLVEEPRLVNNVCYITVAVPRPFKNDEGIYETDFVDCVLWSAIAENTKQYCHKGDIVGVKGRIQPRCTLDEEGNKHKITELIAEKVTFLNSKNPEEN